MHNEFSRVQDSDSSSSSDVPTQRSNSFYQNQLGANMYQIFTGESDEFEEDHHENFPLSDYLGQFVEDFRNKLETEESNQFFSPRIQSDDTIEIPEISTASVSRVDIVVNDLNFLTSGKRSQKFIHTWFDICSTQSYEAKRNLINIITEGYKALAQQSDLIVDFSWSKEFHKRKSNGTNQMILNQIKVFHYIGLGFPPPKDDYIWQLEPNASTPTRYSLNGIVKSFPSLLILDCDRAGILKNYFENKFKESVSAANKIFFVFFACAQNEQLKIASSLPQNFFSCIFLTPMKAFGKITTIKVRDPDMFENLLEIFTETIAFDMLPNNTFYNLFRRNKFVSKLWRRFILAQRLMRTFGVHSQSFPEIIDMSEHQLWNQFEYALTAVDVRKSIVTLSDYYIKNFEMMETPPQYICSFISSLLTIESLRNVIMKKLAYFMEQSPYNCYLIGKVLNIKNLDSFSNFFSEDVLINPDGLLNWCTVVSGLALVFPDFFKAIPCFDHNSGHTKEIESASLNLSIDDKTRALIFSILAVNHSLKPRYRCYISLDLIKPYLPQIFKSSPILREWIAMYIHATLSQFNSEPSYIGEVGLHTLCLLLLSDKRKYTRAIAINILSNLMTRHFPNFNETCIGVAIKGAIDGSHVVRQSFLCCAARYTNLNNDRLTNNADIKIENLISDPIDFVHQYDEIKLRKIIEYLTYDPCDDVKTLARQLFNDPLKSGLDESYITFGSEISKLSHSSLFSHKYYKSKMEQRYTDSLFLENRLELLEIIDTKTNSSVVGLCFDLKHNNVCIATSSGMIIWGNNTWQFSNEPVQCIVSFPKLVLAVAVSDGSIYLLRNGFEDPFEAFQPSTIRPSGPTIMAGVEGKTILYIAQGNNEILVWDIRSLLLICRIEVESPPKILQIVNEYLYAILGNGITLEISIQTNKIIRSNTTHSNMNAIRIGKHRNLLYSAESTGPLYFWEDFQYPRQITDEWNESTDFLVHSEFPFAVKIDQTVRLIHLYEDTPIELQTKTAHRGTCCCFDGNRPLCAIGYDDGKVAVWRIPITNSNV